MSGQLASTILHEWLAEVGLDLADLLDEVPTRQAEIIRFVLPAPASNSPLSAEAQSGLAVLGWAVGERALQDEPKKGLLNALFELFLTIGEPPAAAHLFDLAYPDPDPAHVTYFSQLVQLRLAQNELESAGQTLAEMQQLYPNRFTTLTAQADICLYQNDFAGAQAAYLKALQDSPNSSTLLLGLAKSALQLGNKTEAADWLVRLDENPNQGWNVLRQMAQLWGEVGDAAQAAEKQAAAEEKRAIRLSELAGKRAVTAEKAQADKDKRDKAESSLEIIPELAHTSPETRLPLEAYQVLKEVFGHEQFRPGQEQVIASVLAGRDTLAILPTGAGKSLCYQLPALLLSRPVLVLSPLISLMKDQFDKLPPLLKPYSLVLNSALEPGEAARRLRDLSRPGNAIRLIYAAPERLRQQPFVQALKKANLGLLVVDEAHCVAMWGNDFRPDYLFIRRALNDLADSAPALLAVTATATPDVATEIGQQLGRDLELIRGSAFRPNLLFGVEKVKAGGEYRLERLAEICAGLEGSGIIYTRSREKTEQVAQYLNRHGVAARHYHAGMDAPARRTSQESWMEGQTRIIVATVAFGMGIDKADVRFIIHMNPPPALENYVQEAGRAGRDGQPAQCLLLYSSGDKGNLTRWLREEREQLSLEVLRTLYKAVSRNLGRAKSGIVMAEDLPRGVANAAALLDETLVRVGLSLLERAGLLERGYDLPPSAQVTLRPTLPGLFALESPAVGLEDFIRAAELVPGQSEIIELVAIAARLEITPPELETRLLGWAENGALDYNPARRGYYLELKEAGSDARFRLEEILERREVAADERLDHLEDYLRTRICRQILLARHFGEKLAQPCGVCDNCSRSNTRPGKFSIASSLKNNTSDSSADSVIAAILKAAQDDTGPLLSRTALKRVLLGRDTPVPTEQANSQWAQLQGRINEKNLYAQIDALIEKGLLEAKESRSSYTGQAYNLYGTSEAGRKWLDNPDVIASMPMVELSPPPKPKATGMDETEATRAILGCLALVSGDGEAKVGRSGLIRLLMGQPSALGTRASNRYKGSLEGKLKTKEAEALVEKLIKDGLIEEQTALRAMGGSYQALRVSQAGQFWLEEN